ncbi:MAG: HAD hydrolase family protein [Vicinamibacteria bacterium]|nr:HAD hydrolase family protein [Vicinamibacteria bacterium]
MLTDVDGVLTDGRLYVQPNGDEIKAFHVRDGLGIVLAHRAGLRTGLISGRTSPVVERRARELEMAVALQGIRDKRAALAELLSQMSLQAREVAYIGDDLNDLALLEDVGLAAAPADAVAEARARVHLVTDAPGGRGCLRELIEFLLKAQGAWERLLRNLDAARP